MKDCRLEFLRQSRFLVKPLKTIAAHPGATSVLSVPHQTEPRLDECRQEQPYERVRVILADDHPDFLATAVRVLEPEYQVVKSVGDGQALIDEAAIVDPDVIVLDISMPVLNGLEACRQLKVKGSRAKIVFLTVHQDPDYVRAALGAGGLGYVLKPRLATDLFPAIIEALAGRSFVSPMGAPEI